LQQGNFLGEKVLERSRVRRGITGLEGIELIQGRRVSYYIRLIHGRYTSLELGNLVLNRWVRRRPELVNLGLELLKLDVTTGHLLFVMYFIYRAAAIVRLHLDEFSTFNHFQDLFHPRGWLLLTNDRTSEHF